MLTDETLQIGQVAAVESERLTVELDRTASGLVKAGTYGVLPVGVVNSYVTVAAGADRVIALVTSVRMVQEGFGVASPSSQDAFEGVSRTLEAIMIGRLRNGTFRGGIATYPSLYAPVSIASHADLEAVFRPTNTAIKIGEAVVSHGQDVWLDLDKLLSRHFAVLGSTGSGKSCTVLAILDAVAEAGLENANVVIFDANGEYSAAFSSATSRASRLTSFTFGPHLGADGLSVPLWFLNADEHVELLRAAEGIQAPLLQQALTDARVTGLKEGDLLDGLRLVRRTVETMLVIERESRKPQGGIEEQLDGLAGILEEYEDRDDQLRARWAEMRIAIGRRSELELNDGSWERLSPQQARLLLGICKQLSLAVKDAISDLGMGTRSLNSDLDAPTAYSFAELAELFLPERIDIASLEDPRVRQFMSSLLLRVNRILADDRYAFMSRVSPFDGSLGKFLQLVLGKFDDADVTPGDQSAPWTSRYEVMSTRGEHGHAVTIIDLSHVSSELLTPVTGLIARLIFELAQRWEPRGSIPTLLVLEEAHRYVTPPGRGERTQSSIVFERIAKEGRKYGVSLCLASQRPSELDPTVLSQCGTVIAHRITNQVDQELIRTATPVASREMLRQLPSLATQHAIVVGDATPSPVVTLIRPVVDPPNSQDPSFVLHWGRNDSIAQASRIKAITGEWEMGRRPSEHSDSGASSNPDAESDI